MVSNVRITKILEEPGIDDFLFDRYTLDNEGHDITVVLDGIESNSSQDFGAAFKSRTNTDTIAPHNERKYPIRIFTIQPEG